MKVTDSVEALGSKYTLSAEEKATLTVLYHYEYLASFYSAKLWVTKDSERVSFRNRITDLETNIGRLLNESSNDVLDAFSELREDVNQLWFVPNHM